MAYQCLEFKLLFYSYSLHIFFDESCYIEQQVSATSTLQVLARTGQSKFKQLRKRTCQEWLHHTTILYMSIAQLLFLIFNTNQKLKSQKRLLGKLEQSNGFSNKIDLADCNDGFICCTSANIGEWHLCTTKQVYYLSYGFSCIQNLEKFRFKLFYTKKNSRLLNTL